MESRLVVCNSALHGAPNMIMKKKNGSPLNKRADFQKYSPREPYWLSFFLSVGDCSCSFNHIFQYTLYCRMSKRRVSSNRHVIMYCIYVTEWSLLQNIDQGMILQYGTTVICLKASHHWCRAG